MQRDWLVWCDHINSDCFVAGGHDTDQAGATSAAQEKLGMRLQRLLQLKPRLQRRSQALKTADLLRSARRRRNEGGVLLRERRPLPVRLIPTSDPVMLCSGLFTFRDVALCVCDVVMLFWSGV